MRYTNWRILYSTLRCVYEYHYVYFWLYVVGLYLMPRDWFCDYHHAMNAYEAKIYISQMRLFLQMLEIENGKNDRPEYK